MRSAWAAMLGMLAAAGMAGPSHGYAPIGTVMLFAPGSAEISQDARDALLAFLRPARPPEFRGHCLTGHADRDPGAAALSRARVAAVAAMMQRQGVDPRDIATEARGDAQPVRLSPPGQAEPMNDRVELFPCPGPRLAGVAEAEARALDAVVVPAFVAALAPRVARSLGCPEPEVP
uniref:OmpA family protein n=1 Tax=Roseomonas rosulenta TaxID=2748667 RepID=UPI0018DEFBE3